MRRYEREGKWIMEKEKTGKHWGERDDRKKDERKVETKQETMKEEKDGEKRWDRGMTERGKEIKKKRCCKVRDAERGREEVEKAGDGGGNDA